MDQLTNNTRYITFITELKNWIHESRQKAALTINKELILLYHHIGIQILNSQQKHEWGAKIIDQLSKDLQSEFPEMKGFSTRNLKYMRKFAEEYLNLEFVQQVVAQLPWGHNVILMDKVPKLQDRIFYINKTIEYGWSRNILAMQIDSKLHNLQGKAITNFQNTLPSPQSDLAQSLLKNPYIFDFLSLGKEAHEREIEKNLVTHVEKFLLELGEGFAFLGRQYHIQVENQDFYIDLLFYHIKLKCFVIIDLKSGEFKPEYAGKMNFYLSAVDDILRSPGDNPSIGLLLCKKKGNIIAEYALRGMQKPIGFA